MLWDIASVSDGASTNEAYKIQENVREGDPSDWATAEKIKLVNTGTIDPYRLLWGRKKIRYLGFQGHHPIVDAKRFRVLFSKRYQQAQSTNIVIAGMSSRIEAAVAPAGFLCGKSAVLVQLKDELCPYALTVLLNSKAYNELYRGLFAMRGMNGNSFNIGPRQIERLPVPSQQFLQPFESAIEQRRLSLQDPGYFSWLGRVLHTDLDEKLREHLVNEAESSISIAMETL